MKKKKDFLVYCGNPGVGKTYFCASLIEHILENFRTFRYWKEQDLYRRLRESMDSMKGDYLGALKYLIDDDLVIIDDIGSQGLTEWRKEILFDAIDSRYNSMKPTIITSNMTKKDFQECFHERICSRLFAKDNIIIELDDVDHRE